MTSSETHRDPLKELITHLVEADRLDITDARIYVFGLKKGIITSGDVFDEKIVLRQTTAADRLRRLASKGYFQRTPDEPRMHGRGHAKKYRAIPPEEALYDFLQKYDKIQDCIEKIKESRELLARTSEETRLEDEISLLKPQKVAVSRVAKIIQSAKQSIKIFSHDCTWFDHPKINESLVMASSNKVTIQIFATEADKRIVKNLKKMGVSIKKISVAYIPFCLVDDSMLLLPCIGGTLSTEYFVILTGQKYLVENFIATFNSFLNWSKE